MEVLQLATEAAAVGNVNAATDAGSGAALAGASLRASAMNVRVNAAGDEDDAAARAWIEELEQLEGEAVALQAQLREALMERAGLTMPE